MPGRSSGVPMNSMPAASKADFIFAKFSFFEMGTPAISSYRLIVRSPTPDIDANFAIVQFKAPRAARILDPVIC